jgi:hypothetical protein
MDTPDVKPVMIAISRPDVTEHAPTAASAPSPLALPTMNASAQLYSCCSSPLKIRGTLNEEGFYG